MSQEVHKLSPVSATGRRSPAGHGCHDQGGEEHRENEPEPAGVAVSKPEDEPPDEPTEEGAEDPDADGRPDAHGVGPWDRESPERSDDETAEQEPYDEEYHRHQSGGFRSDSGRARHEWVQPGQAQQLSS